MCRYFDVMGNLFFIVEFGAGLVPKFLAKWHCSAFFVVIWQLVSNHGLIRLKRFFSSIFNALCIRPKIRCNGKS
jgi:hypothetical protein